MITIVTATKYHSIKLFHKSDKPGIVLIANGYYNSSSRCTHYAATELIIPNQKKIPGYLTPYNDLAPINLTNQQEAQKAVISLAQQRTQDHILTAYHDVGKGIEILKAEVQKMNTRLEELTVMRERLASELVTLGLEVTDVKVSKKKLLPTQETQTDMELLLEQQTAVDTLINLNQPIQQPEQHILPPEVLNFINSIAKPNTPYHTDDYVLMVEQTTAGDKVLTIQDKSATATNQPLTPLSQQEVSTILNEVPTTTVTQNVQQFAPDTPMLPVPPPDMIPPEQYIPQADVTNNKQEISAQVNVPTIPSAIPSGSTAKIDIDKDEDIIEVEHDDDDDDDDYDDDDDDDDDDVKATKSNRSHGRPIPIERQNPKRFYCDNCPRSYSRSGDLNKHTS